MNNVVVGMVIALGSAGAIYTDVPGQLKEMFEESIEAAQQVSTAGDLHTMSVLLDACWVMNRYLPEEHEFPDWLENNLKENDVKDVRVDHWGFPYVYELTAGGRKYRIHSVGSDGRRGTDDDMVKTGP